MALAIAVACFASAPIMARVVGHGPNDPFPYAVNATNKPLGPWARVPAVHSAIANDDGTLVAPKNGPTTLLVLGGDGPLGRDLLLRLLYGGIVSIEVGLLAVLIALLIGVALGAAAGLLGGLVDAAVARAAELTMALPVLFLLVLLGSSTFGRVLQGVTLGILNRGVVAVALAIGVFLWFYPARLVRTQLRLLRGREFVEAAEALGGSRRWILRKHLAPHLVPALAAWTTTAVATAVVFEIGVTFLNAGVRLPTSSWGRLLADTWGSPLSPTRFDPAFNSIWPTVFTSLALFLTVAAVFEAGEAVQRALLPERRR